VRALAFISLLSVAACAAPAPPPAPAQTTFASPEAAVNALIAVVKKGSLPELIAIFGPEGKELADSSDPATGRQNREIFSIAVAEGWKLVEQGADKRTLVIGNEDWPFPVPIVKDGATWKFDTAAGKEEVIARRVGRNELSVIQICRAYVIAQNLYARDGHDGKRAGRYATTFRSDPGKQNGLYWPAKHGEKQSPLGDLVADAATEGRESPAAGSQRQPFHGYYFKILTAQGPQAQGGEKDYLANGEMTQGFGLVAWPAEYDVTGVMTFIVNRDGVVHESDLGADTAKVATAMTRYDPDASWNVVK